MQPWLSFVVFLGLLYGGALGLVLRDVEEGSCRTIQNVTSEGVDPIWLDTLPYITGGSKFHLYGLARAHPRFSQMREAELFYDACYIKNTSIIEGTGTIFGFEGRIMGSFTLKRSTDRNNLFDIVPSNPTTGQPGDFFRQKVTLTDYKTFAVLVNCWVGPDQRSWNVYSMLPEMYPATEMLIENHIKSLGFKVENSVFLRRGNCPREIPGNSGDNQGGGQKRPGVNPGHQQLPGGNSGNQHRLGGNYGDRKRSGGTQGDLRRPEWNSDDQQHTIGNQGVQYKLGGNQGDQHRPDMSQKELRRPEWNQGNQHRQGGNQGGHQRHEGSQPGSGASGGSIKRGIPSGGVPSLKNITPAERGPKVLPAKEKCIGRGCNTSGFSVYSSQSGRSTFITMSPGLGWSQPGSSTSTTTTTASSKLGWSPPTSSTTTTASPGLGWTSGNANT